MQALVRLFLIFTKEDCTRSSIMKQLLLYFLKRIKKILWNNKLKYTFCAIMLVPYVQLYTGNKISLQLFFGSFFSQPSVYYFSCFPKELVLNLVTLYYAQGVDGVILPYTQGVLTETESRVGAQRTIILIFAHIQMKNKDIASLSSITRPNPSKNQFWFFPFFSNEIKSENETLVSDR